MDGRLFWFYSSSSLRVVCCMSFCLLFYGFLYTFWIIVVYIYEIGIQWDGMRDWIWTENWGEGRSTAAQVINYYLMMLTRQVCLLVALARGLPQQQSNSKFQIKISKQKNSWNNYYRLRSCTLARCSLLENFWNLGFAELVRQFVTAVQVTGRLWE